MIGAAGYMLLAPIFVQAQDMPANTCVSCHADMWEDIKGSVHSQSGIFCHSCHGGDPAKPDQESAKAAGTGYIGIPDKKQTAQICGTCHADVEMMNFHGIPTDQLARYKTSVHGKMLLNEGDNKVAVCSDCHNYHDVVAVSDTNSPVYPLNLPKTCNKCHGNEKLMSGYGLPSDIFKIYEKSVHGQALFQKKDVSVAHCASCHGSHGAIPPGVKDIGATCGKCHVNEKKFFLESVHVKASEEGRFSECISCHGNHGVEHAGESLYDTSCIKCHDARTPAFAQGQQIRKMFETAKMELTSAEAMAKQAAIEGIYVDEEISSLEAAKTDLIAMAPLQHTLNIAKLSELSEKITDITRRSTQNIQKKRQDLRWRKLALVPIWIFILIMTIALNTRYKQLKSQHEKSRSP